MTLWLNKQENYYSIGGDITATQLMIEAEGFTYKYSEGDDFMRLFFWNIKDYKDIKTSSNSDISDVDKAVKDELPVILKLTAKEHQQGKKTKKCTAVETFLIQHISKNLDTDKNYRIKFSLGNANDQIIECLSTGKDANGNELPEQVLNTFLDCILVPKPCDDAIPDAVSKVKQSSKGSGGSGYRQAKPFKEIATEKLEWLATPEAFELVGKASDVYDVEPKQVFFALLQS